MSGFVQVMARLFWPDYPMMCIGIIEDQKARHLTSSTKESRRLGGSLVNCPQQRKHCS